MRWSLGQYAATPRAFTNEALDCSVRALRIAAGVSYDEAHAALAYWGRKPKHGVYANAMTYAGGRFQVKPLEFDGKPTLAQFIREHRTGRFVILRKGHFFAVVNGVVHDWARGTGARTRVIQAWEKK